MYIDNLKQTSIQNKFNIIKLYYMFGINEFILQNKRPYIIL